MLGASNPTWLWTIALCALLPAAALAQASVASLSAGGLRTALRAHCRVLVHDYRSSMEAYRSSASTDGRLRIFNKWLSEGPNWMQKLLRTPPCLTGPERTLVQQILNDLSQYDASPATTIAQLSGLAGAISTIDQNLTALETSLGR